MISNLVLIASAIIQITKLVGALALHIVKAKDKAAAKHDVKVIHEAFSTGDSDSLSKLFNSRGKE